MQEAVQQEGNTLAVMSISNSEMVWFQTKWYQSILERWLAIPAEKWCMLISKVRISLKNKERLRRSKTSENNKHIELMREMAIVYNKLRKEQWKLDALNKADDWEAFNAWWMRKDITFGFNQSWCSKGADHPLRYESLRRVWFLSFCGWGPEDLVRIKLNVWIVNGVVAGQKYSLIDGIDWLTSLAAWRAI